LSSYGTFYLVVDQPPTFIGGAAGGGITLTIEVRYTVQLIEPVTSLTDDSTIHLVFPEGTMKVTDDNLGVIASGAWESAWDSSAFENVYEVVPQTSAVFTGPDPAKERVAAKYMRTMKTTEGFKCLLFYSSLDMARQVGPNPSRDSSKNLTCTPSLLNKSMQFNRFIGVPVAG
jgi:hypothetical protein